MIARIQIQPPACSDMHWRELVFGINAHPERILVKKESLEDVCACHKQRLELPLPDFQILSSGTKYVSVNRKALFAFVQEHGAICGRST